MKKVFVLVLVLFCFALLPQVSIAAPDGAEKGGASEQSIEYGTVPPGGPAEAPVEGQTKKESNESLPQIPDDKQERPESGASKDA